MAKRTLSRGIIGEKIKGLREKRNLNQSQLAEVLGIKNQTVSNYESGEREPSYDILLKLADYFDVSTDFLLGRTNIERSYEIKIERPREMNIEEEYDADKTLENEIGEIINKFKDVMSFCSEHRKMKTLSKLKSVLSQILNFINEQNDYDTQDFFSIIEFMKRRNMNEDTIFSLKFKQKNIDSCINDLNSFFIAILYDNISKYGKD